MALYRRCYQCPNEFGAYQVSRMVAVLFIGTKLLAEVPVESDAVSAVPPVRLLEARPYLAMPYPEPFAA